MSAMCEVCNERRAVTTQTFEKERRGRQGHRQDALLRLCAVCAMLLGVQEFLP